jgi:hypothetical protein
MPRKRIAMDEDAFVEDCASGLYTHRQLASRYGISLSLVRKILSGQRRPELVRRIAPDIDVGSQRAQRRLVALADKAMGVLSRAMDGPPTEATLAAARVVLDLALGEPGAPEPKAGEQA